MHVFKQLYNNPIFTLETEKHWEIQLCVFDEDFVGTFSHTISRENQEPKSGKISDFYQFKSHTMSNFFGALDSDDDDAVKISTSKKGAAPVAAKGEFSNSACLAGFCGVYILFKAT